jgi:hypothetical protein
MKRRLLVMLLFVFAFSLLANAAPKKKKKGPCAPSLAKCPVTGCGGDIDENLNRRKNIKTAPGTAEDMTLDQIRALDDPVAGFAKGDTREKLNALGEGKKIRVVALALIVRTGSKESCNCGLTGAANTDNHIVLIDPNDNSPSLEADEPDSVTAEFTPRVRKTHPNLSRAKLKPLIDAAPNNALKVRVTGVLMFDSEHSLGRHLTRHNDWEIHPVFGLEYCPKNKTCSEGSNANWKNIEQ